MLLIVKCIGYIEAKGYLTRSGHSSAARLLSAPSRQGERTAHDNANSIKAKIKAYIADHPEIAEMSISSALYALKAAGMKVGRTTVSEVLAERRAAS